MRLPLPPSVLDSDGFFLLFTVSLTQHTYTVRLIVAAAVVGSVVTVVVVAAAVVIIVTLVNDSFNTSGKF